MSERGGLKGLWDDFSDYLGVDIEVTQDESPNTNLPAIIKFTVTNVEQAQEDQPEIIFEEVQLKVNVGPDLRVEAAENLTAGQSFTYEHHCTYDDVMKIQWNIEGKLSPASLLQFRRRPSSIKRNMQFPIKAYFDFLEQMKIHQWIDDPIKLLVSPDPNTTLAEMKEKEKILSDTIGEIRDSAQRLQDFLSLVNYERNREDLLRHHQLVKEYFQVTERNISELIKILRENRVEQFNKKRENSVNELNIKAGNLDENTKALATKLGIIEASTKDEDNNETLSGVEPPPPITLREIDLHGNNLETTIPVVNKFLEKCYQDNVRRVRIIHGKGIFVLQKAIREILGTHKLVKAESISAADKDHGGEGATEANLIDYSAELLD
ncbi:Smr/MutS family protein [Chloroflexota bacterium]